jgi:hypothetical protein
MWDYEIANVECDRHARGRAETMKQELPHSEPTNRFSRNLVRTIRHKSPQPGNSKTSLFWGFTQCWLVVTGVSGQPIGPKGKVTCFALSVKMEPTGYPETSATNNDRWLTIQKSEYLTPTEVKAWNHTPIFDFLCSHAIGLRMFEHERRGATPTPRSVQRPKIVWDIKQSNLRLFV